MKQLVYYTTGDQKIPVLYTYEMDGGGTTFGQEVPSIVSQRWPGRRFRSALDWCSGPGFIGYNLIDHQLVDRLCLVDLYHPALTIAKITATTNSIANQVDFFLLDDISLLPAAQQFDLVIANPPHYSTIEYNDYHRSRIMCDKDWAAHRNFYSNIKKNLSADGVIYMQENLNGSTVETFLPMIESAGLAVKDWFLSPDFSIGLRGTLIYYIEITHKDQT